jgi:hypothetical protein
LQLKIISLFVVFLLVISSLSAASADNVVGSDNSKQIPFGNSISMQSSEQHVSKNYQISLSENIGMSENHGKQNNSLNQPPTINNHIVSLSENIGLVENNNSKIVLTIAKQNLNEKMITDRLGSKRFKNQKISNDLQNISWLGSQSTASQFGFDTKYVGQFYGIQNISILHSSYAIISDSFITLENDFNIFSSSSANEIIKLAHGASDPKNPTILILLIPLSGYILFRSEDNKLRITKAKQILSFCFVIILISSIVVTPLSVSPIFLRAVYAEETNSTLSPSFQSSNATHLLPSFQYSNSTLSPSFQSSNATHLLPSFQYSNSTLSPSFQSSNATHLLPSFQYSNSTIPTNQTTGTSSLPNATKSWQFDLGKQNFTMTGNAKIRNDTGVMSLKLTGTGYLSENVNSTRNLSNFTVSSWVKPDYSQGSPQFTIVSKENQFILAINNVLPPQKIAIFSIFDGVKWNTVNSTLPIDENWTNIAATFNGTSISIYVNGTLQSTAHISGVPYIAINGKLETKTVDNLSSNADVIIGAYVNTLRGHSTNEFSGSIQSVKLYDSLLSPEQIAHLGSVNNSPLNLNSLLPGQKTTNSTLSFQYSNSTMSFQSSNATQPLLPTNSTLDNTTIVTDLTLKHAPIQINKPVIWTQNVTLSNQTDKVAVELPQDAKITKIEAINSTHVSTVYSSNTTLSQTNVSLSGLAGISNNTDIKKIKASKLEFVNDTNNTQMDSATKSVTINNDTTPIASLSDLPGSVQKNKPTKLILVNDTAQKYNIQFATPAPYTVEKDVSTKSTFDKLVTVEHNSTLHYTNVTSFSNISEDLVKKGVPFKLYWLINGSKTDVTQDPRFNVKLVDTNGNGIADQMQWTVPKLSAQNFEIQAQINVINVQSYPIQGGNWTVYFTTTGTADLNITGINGTQFGNATPADLQFLLLNNGTTALNVTRQGNSIIYHNYSSNQTGYETSHVITFGKHHLMFQFGDSVAYANNNAAMSSPISANIPLSITFDSSNDFVYSNNGYVAISNSNGVLQHNSTGLSYFGVAVNSTGYTYAVNTNTNQIDIYNSAWTVVGNIGTGVSGNGNNQFSSPTGIAIDSSNNIYVADTGNDRVQEFDTHGNYLRTFGSSGTGTGQFLGPMGVAVNGTGYVYVTDAGNDRVEIFDPSATYKSSFGSTGNGNTQFNSPTGIAIDKIFNNVYVADVQNDRVQKFDKNGNYIQTLTNSLDGPISVAVDSNNYVYVADSNNNAIKQFQTDYKPPTDSLGFNDVLKAHISIKNLQDSLSLNDNTVNPHVSSRTQPLSDSLSLNDNTVNPHVSSRTQPLSDSLSLNDNTVNPRVSIKNLQDSLSLNDNTVNPHVSSQTKSLSDSLSLNDNTVNAHISIKNLQDSLSLNDNTIGTQNLFTKSLSDSLSLNDNTVNAHISIKNLQDSLSLNDNTVNPHVSSQTKSLSDSLSLNDNTVNPQVSVLNLHDSLSLNDNTVNVQNTLTKSLSDSLSLNDNTVNPQVSVLNLHDSLSLNDNTVNPQVSVLNLHDSLSLNDNTVNAHISIKNLQDSLAFNDNTVNVQNTLTKSLSDSLSLNDNTVNPQVSVLNLHDSLSLNDNTVNPHISVANLQDSLGLNDNTVNPRVSVLNLHDSLSLNDNTVNVQNTFTTNLHDSLSLNDNTVNPRVSIKNLQDSLGLNDTTVNIQNSFTKSLSDSLSLNDNTVSPHISIKNVQDSLGLNDNTVNVQNTLILNLQDSLGLNDNTVNPRISIKNLQDSLGLNDNTVNPHISVLNLHDSLSLNDNTVSPHISIKNIQDSLGLNDNTVNVQNTLIANLQDSLGLNDNTVNPRVSVKNFQDSLSLNDNSVNTRASITKSFPESLSLNDNTVSAQASITKSLSDSLGLNDSAITTQKSFTKSLSDSLSLVHSIKFKGGVKIQALDENNHLVANATYTITPDPNGGPSSEVATDGGAYDHDGIHNGVTVVTLIPFGPYNITMTHIPAGYNVLGNSTVYTVDNSNINGTSIFRLVAVSTNLTTLPKTVITSAPNLNGTTLDTWKSSFNAIKVNGTNSTNIDAVQNLPPIISAGNVNQSQITSAINSQASVLLQTSSFSQNTPGSQIIKSLGVPTYSVPKSNSVVSVIPTIIAAPDASNPSQSITTPPLDKIVPGQQMYLPVQSSIIPPTGGLKLMDIKSNSSKPSSNATSDWFVIKTINALPSSKPALPSNDKLSLYINVTYAYEENHQGFNWGDPHNFATPPKLTLQLPKNPSGVKVDSNGCPASDIFVYDPNANSWTTNPVTIISTTPTVGNSNSCDVVVQTQHFSQFALGAPPVSSSPSPSPGSTSSGTSSIGGGGGGTGTGFGVGASSGASNNGGGAGPYLKIEKISYETCDNQTAIIQVATDVSDTDPMVIVRTSVTGVVSAQLLANQPYAQENSNSTIRHLVYQASLSPKETSFEVVALESISHNIFSVGKTVIVNGCGENLDYTQTEITISPVQVDLSAPKIFDVRAQVGNGTKQPADSTQFVDNKPLTVYAIVDTPTQMTSAELRSTSISDSSGQYDAVTMNVVPLQISNSTYLLSGTISSSLLQAPAVKYWVHVENSANKKIDSDIYTIGVKPSYPILGSIDLDVKGARAEGTTGHPTAYFVNNSTGQVYGNIVLAVNGTVVYASQPQIFNTGQTKVNLEWKTNTVGKISSYRLQARAEIFGNEIVDNTPPNAITFPGTDNMPLSQLSTVKDVLLGNVTVAKASVLYSSFVNDGTMRYKVTSPDGTCVIGPSDSCLVSSSTIGQPGGIKSITLGDQVYRVRYTGSDDSLERFSITSADSLGGDWKVEIDSTNTMAPVTHAMDDTVLKVKYRAVDTPFITEKP